MPCTMGNSSFFPCVCFISKPTCSYSVTNHSYYVIYINLCNGHQSTSITAADVFIWSPLGIESRTACLIHKHYATESYNNQLANKHSNSCIYTVKGYCYATISLSTDQRKFSFFQRFFYLWNFLLC